MKLYSEACMHDLLCNIKVGMWIESQNFPAETHNSYDEKTDKLSMAIEPFKRGKRKKKKVSRFSLEKWFFQTIEKLFNGKNLRVGKVFAGKAQMLSLANGRN